MEETLIAQAFQAREFSYCPYSGFAVGAALLAEDGQVFTGCNVENAAYGPSNCAERGAFFRAVSEGVRSFRAIAIVGGSKECKEGEVELCAPCGICRQVMREFCFADFKIILAKDRKHYEVHTLGELLPLSFGSDNLISADNEPKSI